jgi:hypothetical protein
VKCLYRFLCGLLLLLCACGEEESVPAQTGKDFFPLKVGHSWIYKVDETIYSEVKAPEHKVYRLKLEVGDSIVLPGNMITYIIYRSTQELDANHWSSLDTWSARKNDYEVVVDEGNTSFKKLIFPLRDGLTWDGNQYNTLGPDSYTMTRANTVSVMGTVFTETLKVEQERNDDLIVFLDEREEFYAKDIGLVKRSVTQLNYCTAEDCIGQQKIKSGKIYLQELVSYESN